MIAGLVVAIYLAGLAYVCRRCAKAEAAAAAYKAHSVWIATLLCKAEGHAWRSGEQGGEICELCRVTRSVAAN